ncbi:MAG: hypothetical protein MUE92_06890 [Chloroflexi bacterium]|jgi:hypothetical protein|nr:hypothetical protein [Chloroflexota bacterium]
MFRRPPPSPPPTPLGIEDLEEEPRPPLISRRTLTRAAALFVGGIAWGAAVRFADSLPVDAGFIGFVLKVGGGFAFVLAIALVLLFRGFEVDRVAIAALFAVAGATIGLSVGPTLPPAVVVTGVFSFVPSVPTGLPTSDGELECEWANGRWKIGALRAAPIDGFVPPPRLQLDFLRKTMSLSDDDGSTLVAVGNDAFVSPPDAPPRGEGDRSGVLDLLLLQVDLESTPEDPLEVQARFTWDCPGPPSD